MIINPPGILVKQNHPILSKDENGELSALLNHFLEKTRTILKDMTDLFGKNDALATQISEPSKDSAESISCVKRGVNALKSGSEKIDESIAKTAGRINEYADSHSSGEKRFMESFGSPLLRDDKRLRASYEERVPIVEKTPKAGGFDAALLSKIQDKGVNRLRNHITKVEMR